MNKFDTINILKIIIPILIEKRFLHNFWNIKFHYENEISITKKIAEKKNFFDNLTFFLYIFQINKYLTFFLYNFKVFILKYFEYF